MSVSKDECSTHCKALESFCRTCNISACRDCEHFTSCFKSKHDVIPMRSTVDAFNQEATAVIQTAKDVEQKLNDTYKSIFDDKSNFKSELEKCRTTIKMQTKTIIDKVEHKSYELMLYLDNIDKQNDEAIKNKVKELESKQMQVQSMMASVNKMMTESEDKEKLVSHKTVVIGLRKKVLETGFDQTKLPPNFTPCAHLDDVLKREVIGKITCVRFTVDVSDQSITVLKGQPFAVKVSRMIENDAYPLAATLRNSSGEEFATEVEDQGSREYRITGTCNEEGDWQMAITDDGVAQIKGSPVNIKVEKLGLVHTIGNIADHQIHKNENPVRDVVVDADGCILASSKSKVILKFNQSGLFVDRIHVPQDVKVGKMYQLDNGNIVYSDTKGKRVVMCDSKFNEIRSFGKGKLKYPAGLTVNKESRIMYVADRDKEHVFKFNVDDGRLLGKIGSFLAWRKGYIYQPHDVTLNKEGHVIVADYYNLIQMFDANDKFIKILVEGGKDDGKVLEPRSVTMDMDGNIIVSSNHKIQLFDENGVFIKRIDHKDDGLDNPAGICVISKRPRKLAVANKGSNNIKIFNY